MTGELLKESNVKYIFEEGLSSSESHTDPSYLNLTETVNIQPEPVIQNYRRVTSSFTCSSRNPFLRDTISPKSFAISSPNKVESVSSDRAIFNVSKQTFPKKPITEKTSALGLSSTQKTNSPSPAQTRPPSTKKLPKLQSTSMKIDKSSTENAHRKQISLPKIPSTPASKQLPHSALSADRGKPLSGYAKGSTPGALCPKLASTPGPNYLKGQLRLTGNKPGQRKLVPATVAVQSNLWKHKKYKPKTPLIAPNFCITSSGKVPEIFKDDQSDPWVKIPEPGHSTINIKILGITSDGMVANVPTANDKHIKCNTKPNPPTQRYTIEKDTNPMLDTKIITEWNKKRDYVPDRMRALSEFLLDVNKQYKTELKPVPTLTGMVSPGDFEDLLNLYENNQVYYQEHLNNKTMCIADIEKYLTELEHWFIKVIEPSSYSDDLESWIEREKSKSETGYSPYCDPELYPFIKPATQNIKKFIKSCHDNLLPKVKTF